MIDKSNFAKACVPRSASEILCSNLSQGLHAAAQPLTILRASLGNDQLDRMSMADLRELAASSAGEVERVCILFSCLQELVTTESIKPHSSGTQLLPLLTKAIDGVKILFDEDRIFLKLKGAITRDLVLIDSARTLQAFSRLLLSAHAMSQAEDTVDVIVVSSSSQAVRVVVRNLNSLADAPSAEVSLSMALAEANIRSQQGTFSWSLQPFSVQIEFPQATTTQSI